MSEVRVPLRRLVELKTERAEEQGFKVGLENLESWTGRFVESESVFEGDGVAFRAGDVLFGKLRPYLAKAWVADRAGAAVGDFFVLRPRAGTDSRFVRDVLLSPDSIKRLSAAVYGSKMPRASWESVGALEVAVASIEAQRAAVDWSEGQTAEIDAFIGDQERLIALLEERRLSVLRVALDAPGWRRGNIRAFARMRTGHTPSRSTPEYWLDTEVPWFTLADVWQLREGRQYVSETNERINPIGLANSAAELLPAGTVMLSRTASVGFTGIMETSMATSQDFWNWVPGPRLRPEFLWYQLRAMRPYFMSLVQGSTHKTIYQADAASLMISVPTLEEQDAIISRLDVETTAIDAAVADAREAIALSKERRAALISAAVTGRIDVAERKRVLA